MLYNIIIIDMHKYEILQDDKKPIAFILILYFIYFLNISFYKKFIIYLFE